MLVNVACREWLITQSEVCWLNQYQFVLTVNNEFYLMNINHKDKWVSVENNI